MDTYINIKKVALLFFVVLGILHIGSSLAISNIMFVKEAVVINKTLDIPFIITSLIYGLSSLRISLAEEDKSHTILDAVLISVVVLIFVALIVVNLFVPDFL